MQADNYDFAYGDDDLFQYDDDYADEFNTKDAGAAAVRDALTAADDTDYNRRQEHYHAMRRNTRKEREAREEEARKLRQQEHEKRIELGRQKRNEENAHKRNKLREKANLKKQYLEESVALDRSVRRQQYEIEERERQKELRHRRRSKWAKYEKIKPKTSGDMLLSFWGMFST